MRNIISRACSRAKRSSVKSGPTDIRQRASTHAGGGAGQQLRWSGMVRRDRGLNPARARVRIAARGSSRPRGLYALAQMGGKQGDPAWTSNETEMGRAREAAGGRPASSPTSSAPICRYAPDTDFASEFDLARQPRTSRSDALTHRRRRTPAHDRFSARPRARAAAAFVLGHAQNGTCVKSLPARGAPPFERPGRAARESLRRGHQRWRATAPVQHRPTPVDSRAPTRRSEKL